MLEVDELIRKQDITRFFKKSIYQYFNHECVYCGAIANSLDHVIPQSKGGKTVASNLVAACKPCNGNKGDRELFEWFRSRSHWSEEREQAIAKWLNYQVIDN